MKNIVAFFSIVVISLSVKAQEQKVEIVPDSILRSSLSTNTVVIRSSCGYTISGTNLNQIPSDSCLPFKLYDLSSKQENWFNMQSVYNSIQAKVPNVTITTSADFNAIPRIRMRGDDHTIVIVDGIRFDASILNMLNPADIESVTVAPSVAASNFLRNR